MINTHQISQEKKDLIKQFHTVLNKNGMMHEKPQILESAGVESTKDLNEAELQELIDILSGEMDKWRKRVIAAIFNYCRDINCTYDIKKVKALAVRSAGAEYKTFNDIPKSRLRDIYNEFRKKNRVTVGSRSFKEEMITYLESRN